jgi:hypothetical protein
MVRISVEFSAAVIIHSLSSSVFRIRPSGLVSIRINLELWMTVDRTFGMVISPVARPLPLQNSTQKSSMPRVGFQHTTPVFERAKIFHALYRVATVIGSFSLNDKKIVPVLTHSLTHSLMELSSS